jgi:ribonuclease HI
MAKIALPKESGGWGLRNLKWFSLSLATKSCWRGLFGDGLWSKVLRKKYLKGIDVPSWIKRNDFKHSVASVIWRNLMTTMPIILRWTAWTVGCGKQISLGMDAFVGGNDRCFLSHPLISHLHNLNIFSLAQAALPNNSTSSTVWIDSKQLNLSGELALEWDNFILAIRSNGIYLKDSCDKLVWSWNRALGIVTVKQAYQSILYSNLKGENRWWYKAIWHVNVPSKIICFIWLCLMDNILTGVNYQRRGGIGPSVCSLCLNGEDSTDHLFTHCVVSKLIWKEVLSQLMIHDEWGEKGLEDNLLKWFIKYPKLRHIPFMVIWGIWKYRNKRLFENWARQDSSIGKKNLLSIQEFHDETKPDSLDYILSPVYFDDSPIGFFDGAATENRCGIGICLKLSSDHIYQAYFAGGEGSNMKAEIQGLWGLLHLASLLSLSNLMVVGDSKSTIDWIKGETKLNCLYLSPWQERIRNMQDKFESISFMHVHRNFNIVVDQLSKQALNCTPGWFFIEELVEGAVAHVDRLPMF